MKTIEAEFIITPDGSLNIAGKLDLLPGHYRAVLIVEEYPISPADALSDPHLINFPVDDLGVWPKDLSLRREDLYDDAER